MYMIILRGNNGKNRSIYTKRYAEPRVYKTR